MNAEARPIFREEVSTPPKEREMNTYLKIKIKTLASEAKAIRLEERKAKAKMFRKAGAYTDDKGRIRMKWVKKTPGELPSEMFFNLKSHRKDVVRPESRASNLAYGFLRGRPYRAMEEKCYTEPNWDRVEYMIKKFGVGDERVLLQRFAEWKDQ